MLLEIIFLETTFNGSKFQRDFIVLIRLTEFKKEKILFWFIFLAPSYKIWKTSECLS